jgi:hypothetical protein
MDPMMTQALPYVVPLLILALILRRALRSRTVKMEQLWVYPAILAALAGSAIAREPLPGPITLAGLVAALIVGGLIGWYRGRLTQITIDPKTHVLTSKASVAGTVLIAVVFAIRYGLEMAVQGRGAVMPTTLHLDVAGITDGLMVFLVAMMSVQRIEMFIRCQKLLGQARAGGVAA